jgi:hypothetical protein
MNENAPASPLDAFCRTFGSRRRRSSHEVRRSSWAEKWPSRSCSISSSNSTRPSHLYVPRSEKWRRVTARFGDATLAPCGGRVYQSRRGVSVAADSRIHSSAALRQTNSIELCGEPRLGHVMAFGAAGERNHARVSELRESLQDTTYSWSMLKICCPFDLMVRSSVSRTPPLCRSAIGTTVRRGQLRRGVPLIPRVRAG